MYLVGVICSTNLQALETLMKNKGKGKEGKQTSAKVQPEPGSLERINKILSGDTVVNTERS